MSKIDSLIKFSGTFDGITVVKSGAYGVHIRAKRGSRKKATVNEAFAASGREIVAANVYAGLVKRAIDLYRHDFPGGMLWQELVSLFKGQYKATGGFDLRGLTGLEVNEKKPLLKHYDASFDVSVDAAGRTIAARPFHKRVPNFGRQRFFDFYRFRLAGLFPNEESGVTLTSETCSPVLSMTKGEAPGVLETAIPDEHAGLYILLLRLEGLEAMGEDYRMQVLGMRVLQGGKIL